MPTKRPACSKPTAGASLVDWIRWAQGNGMRLDESTAVVLDLDKTAIGARGRNNRAIDVARLKGLYRTVGSLLDDKFNASLFAQHYEQLNRAHYHHLTGDNQDYLAYICLVLNNEGLDCTDLLERIEDGSVQTFEQFVRYAEVCIAGGGRVSEAMRQAMKRSTWRLRWAIRLRSNSSGVKSLWPRWSI